MNRRKFLTTTAALGAATVARPFIAHGATREIIVAEPGPRHRLPAALCRHRPTATSPRPTSR